MPLWSILSVTVNWGCVQSSSNQGDHWPCVEKDPSKPVPISRECRKSAEWQLRKGALEKGVPLCHPLSSNLQVHRHLLERLRVHLLEVIASGVWTRQELDEHINTLEMRAVLSTLMAFQDRMRVQDIVPMSDTSPVVEYVNKRGNCSQISVPVDKKDLPVDRDTLC